MKKTKKALSLLLAVALVVTMLCVAVVPVSAADNPYSIAAMALDSEYAYDGELGALYTPEATTFRLWAPLATEVDLNRYTTGSNNEPGAREIEILSMEKLMDGDHWTGVWTATVEGDIVNTYYTYTVVNPDHIYNSKKIIDHETQDIYSYAVGVNGNRSMVVDLDQTDPEGWEYDSHVFTEEQSDAIVWEIQVKDFSYNENSGVSAENRGKFLGFTETGTTLNGEGIISTGIDYLKDLGVTYVQINPFYDFATINEAGDDTQFNWGYDPKNYGVPEGSYSSNPYDGNVRIKECKQMIKALHDAGIGVIMDVVYNHTYSVDGCFNYSVPEYYYRMASNGSYSQQSGCGNDTASERAMYRKYMRDMLKYWTEEYHIDGYRFDLMGVHDAETMNMIRADMDEIDPRIVMYGEGWGGNTIFDPYTCTGSATFMCTQANAADISSRIGFFNDQIRDGIKGGVFDGPTSEGFVNGAIDKYVTGGINANTIGKNKWAAVSPEQCVTYASCHDNMTLYDKLVAANYNQYADYRARYNDVIQQNKLTAGIISSSQGIDFILAGEEMGRSKDGDENSYKSAATLNMIDWSLLETNADLVSYYRGMFELRKAFSPFTASVKDSLDDTYKYTFFTSRTAMVDLIAYSVTNNVPGEWNKVAVIYNGSKRDTLYTLSSVKDPDLSQDTEWVIVANDKSAGVKKLGEIKGLHINVPASTCMILVEKNTFEECNIQSDMSQVTIEHIYDATGEKISECVLQGKAGTGYIAPPDTSIPLEYTLDHVIGDVCGTYSDVPATVQYVYTDYVPVAFCAPRGDLNDDGVVDIVDATILQRYLADMTDLDDEHVARGDYNSDGDTDIDDVTALQRFLADMIKPVYNVTAMHLIDNGDGTTSVMTTAVTQKIRYGDKYQTSPASVPNYALRDTPKNASGVVNGNTRVVYYYVYTVYEPVVHIKHSGSETWAPTLWAWAYEGTTPVNCYPEWPGMTLKNKDNDGWYTTTITIPGGLDYYFIVNKNGSPQTADYGPISYDDYPEIWIVINDDAIGADDGKWVSYYSYNPDLQN